MKEGEIYALITSAGISLIPDKLVHFSFSIKF